MDSEPFSEARTKREVLTLPVLLLNRHFSPVSVATVRRAFVLLYGGAARAVDAEGETYDFSAWRHVPVRSLDDGLPIRERLRAFGWGWYPGADIPVDDGADVAR